MLLTLLAWSRLLETCSVFWGFWVISGSFLAQHLKFLRETSKLKAQLCSNAASFISFGSAGTSLAQFPFSLAFAIYHVLAMEKELFSGFGNFFWSETLSAISFPSDFSFFSYSLLPKDLFITFCLSNRSVSINGTKW